MPATDRDALRRLLRARSVQTGDFVLASGARSSYYIDARLTTMSGTGQLLIGSLGLAAMDERGWQPASVGGLTLGADPVAYAIAHAAAAADRNLDAFTVRKQAKSHGTGSRIEGTLREGTTVVVIEDVITSGGSALEAVAVAEEAGATVLGVLSVVLREDSGRRRIEEAGYAVVSLFTAGELLKD
ncbi:orotate phosphoribosyltransferase [soil metagenome]